MWPKYPKGRQDVCNNQGPRSPVVSWLKTQIWNPDELTAQALNLVYPEHGIKKENRDRDANLLVTCRERRIRYDQ